MLSKLYFKYKIVFAFMKDMCIDVCERLKQPLRHHPLVFENQNLKKSLVISMTTA